MQASIYCPHCHKYTALTIAKVPYNYNGQTYLTNALWKHPRGYTWWIGICNGCSEPCLILNNGDIVYPSPLPKPTSKLIPSFLKEDLDESKKCFSNGCYRASAVMARRVIQSACKDKGAKENDLVKQIQELTQAGIITKDIEEWAHVVRWIGNDAAHVNKDPVTKEDADDCLQLAEQFLHVVYVTPAIAKAQRTARGK
jgi:HEPN domain-containing protein